MHACLSSNTIKNKCAVLAVIMIARESTHVVSFTFLTMLRLHTTTNKQYEGRRLEVQTILVEEELAPLFDGAYWPGTDF